MKIKKKSDFLRKYYRDEPVTKGTDVIVNFTNNGFGELFTFIKK